MKTEAWAIEYILTLIKTCDTYPFSNIPGSYQAGGQFIKLHDVYTHLTIISRSTFENLKNNGKKATAIIEKEPPSTISEPYKYLYLSPPGGGKSTRLKMLCLSYAYLFLKSIDYNFDSDEFRSIVLGHFNTGVAEDNSISEVEQWKSSLESLCSETHVTQGAFPIYVDMKSLRGIENIPSIDYMIADYFRDTIMRSSNFNSDMDDKHLFTILEEQEKLVLFIDGLEECFQYSSQYSLVDLLDKYIIAHKNVIKISLSSRYEEFCNFELMNSNESTLNSMEQIYILEFVRGIDQMHSFAEKWYKALGKVNRTVFDADLKLIEPLSKLKFDYWCIKNPLVLTGLLMSSISDSFQSSDLGQYYEYSLKSRVMWTAHNKYNYDDVVIQLARIAYHMSISETNQNSISEQELITLIYNSRTELNAYFRQEWSLEEKDIRRFCKFLVKSTILACKDKQYEISLYTFQAYLTAYCIVNDFFPRDKRLPSRYAHIESHIKNKENLWEYITLFSYILDTELGDLRDDIFNNVSDLAISNVDDTGYYSRLALNIATAAYRPLYLSEQDRISKIVVRAIANDNIFGVIYTPITNLFFVNSEEENNLLIEEISKAYATLDSNMVHAFGVNAAILLFYCFWNCKVSERYIKPTAVQFFRNYVSPAAFKSLPQNRFGSYNSKALCCILEELDAEASCEDGNMSTAYKDYLANIYAYSKEDLWPCDIVFSLIKSDNEDDKMMALIILKYAARLQGEENIAYHYRFNNDPSQMEELSSFFKKGLTTSQYPERYFYVFLDLYNSPMPSKWLQHMEDEDIFKYCLNREFTKWKAYNNSEVWVNNNDSLSYDLMYIATYPWKTAWIYVISAIKTNSAIKEMVYNKGFISFLSKIANSNNDNQYYEQIFSLKLLAIFLNDKKYIGQMLLKMKHHLLSDQSDMTIFNKRMVTHHSIDEEKEMFMQKLFNQLDNFQEGI